MTALDVPASPPRPTPPAWMRLLPGGSLHLLPLRLVERNANVLK
jgi:hypothetical protein